MPFLTAVGSGAAIAMRPIAGFRLRVVGVAFVAYGAAAVMAYGLIHATWFEKQTPAHVVLRPRSHDDDCREPDPSMLRLTVTAVAVGAFALVKLTNRSNEAPCQPLARQPAAITSSI